MLKPTREAPVTYLLLAVVVLGLLYAAYQGASNGVQPSLIVSSIVFGLASLAHAIHLLGWNRALTFFLVTIVLAFLAETLSIATCLATCYEYTEALGPRLGLVPIVIPASWFIMIYAGYVIVNLITEGRPVSTRGGNIWIILLALLTALVMTAWDLTLDPYMVTKEKAWIWLDGGAYFGVPFANYVSWLETTFIIVLVYRLVERGLPLRPLVKVTPLFAAIPVMIFALMGLPDMFVGEPIATRVFSPFSVGIPVLAAFARLWQMGQDALEPAPPIEAERI